MTNTKVSTYLAQIENLCNLAKHHRKTCNESGCGVSLLMLEKTVMILLWKVPHDEFNEASRMIHEIDWN